MRFYRISLPPGYETPQGAFFATREDAHSALKERGISPTFSGDCYVDLLEISSDKDVVLALLNGYVEDARPKTLKTWRLTDRGGLKEVPVEKEESDA
jgi:hypothetical protein